MTARCTIGPTAVIATRALDRLEVVIRRGDDRLLGSVEWSGSLASSVRRWARGCLADLQAVGPWSYWGRRAGRWTLLAEQMPTCAVWNAAYRIGGRAIVVAHGHVEPVQSVRCFHGQRAVSEAVMRARLAVEEAAIEWVRSVWRALCADLGEASLSEVAA